MGPWNQTAPLVGSLFVTQLPIQYSITAFGKQMDLISQMDSVSIICVCGHVGCYGN